ncbi:MAG: hypothetical protein AAF501_08040 [Pseudomonadota bacterium]
MNSDATNMFIWRDPSASRSNAAKCIITQVIGRARPGCDGDCDFAMTGDEPVASFSQISAAIVAPEAGNGTSLFPMSAVAVRDVAGAGATARTHGGHFDVEAGDRAPIRDPLANGVTVHSRLAALARASYRSGSRRGHGNGWSVATPITKVCGAFFRRRSHEIPMDRFEAPGSPAGTIATASELPGETRDKETPRGGRISVRDRADATVRRPVASKVPSADLPQIIARPVHNPDRAALFVTAR